MWGKKLNERYQSKNQHAIKKKKKKDPGRFEKVPNNPSNIKTLSLILKKISKSIEEIFVTYRGKTLK